MKLRSFRGLHRDQRGQIVPLFMLGLVSIVLSVAMILNTGRAVHNRTRVQNAADAAAITQASWAARSLNVISMNNVGLVHMFTVFMVSNAFSSSWRDVMKTAGDKAKQASNAYSICMGAIAWTGIGAAACKVYKGYSAYMRAIQAQLAAIELRYAVTSRGLPTSMRLIDAFGRMSDQIVNEFPRFSWEIAEKMREENGADEVLFFPISQKGRNDRRYRGTAIPVSGGLFNFFGPMVEICKAAEEGPGRSILGLGDVRVNFAKHGYTRRAGPYFRSREDPGWILTSTKMSDVIPMPPPSSPFLDPVFPFPAGGPLTRLWAAQWVPLPAPLFLDSDPDWPTSPVPAGTTLGMPTPPPLLPPKWPWDIQLPFFDDEPWSNDYARQMRDDWKKTCRIGGETSKPAILSRPKVFMLTDPNPMVQLATPGQGSSKLFLRDALALMAFAVKREESVIAPNKFENPPGGTYAYAQAHVYNIVSYDLYTQAWGARLEPARFLEDSGKRDEVVRALQREDGFDDLHELFRRIPAGDFRRVSAH